MVIVCDLMMVFGVFMLIRNHRVFKERERVREQMAAAATDDINHERPWEWRYQMYESVTYDQMVAQFWRPVRSFFPADITRKGPRHDHAPVHPILRLVAREPKLRRLK